MINPYSDERLTWDESDGRYYITEQALKNNGLDLRARLSDNDTISADVIVNKIIRYSTSMIYNFIHAHNEDNRTQDRLIAGVPSLRNIIYHALLAQAEYLTANGDPSLSLDPNIRALAISEMAKLELYTDVEELGVSICYSGGFGWI